MKNTIILILILIFGISFSYADGCGKFNGGFTYQYNPAHFKSYQYGYNLHRFDERHREYGYDSNYYNSNYYNTRSYEPRNNQPSNNYYGESVTFVPSTSYVFRGKFRGYYSYYNTGIHHAYPRNYTFQKYGNSYYPGGFYRNGHYYTRGTRFFFSRNHRNNFRYGRR